MATPHSPRPTSQKHLSPLAYLCLAVVHFYRYAISPMLAPRCRFYPTCSQYALEAIQLYGGIKGGWLALKRIARCHPLSPSGEDPVPVKHRACHGEQCDGKPDPSTTQQTQEKLK